MARTEDPADLAALYEQLQASMQDTHAIIDRLDEALARAGEEWTSKGAYAFKDAWHNGFKPSLTKLCQELATAGSDVAFQHTELAERAEGSHQHPHLTPLKSPR
jgi:uncharacterized protein YukE